MKILILMLALLNVYGFTIMYIDKQKARKQKWRISEVHLWTVTLLGGALGIWAGMSMFRHKTQHRSFRFGVPMLILVHFTLCIWFTFNVV
ncbi:DUF1294 domain-containing protein [Alkalihalobacillus sp. AL-G]|uniref:DUF1294 domain-containing protein n=1 Tax=Alkalihalobacillus sp. AL-G TaxID=2926399 RepID=UPI00272B70B3|nr:DUF1294 domain-containing protein [Alkalihalobacillus sp. AL-G]WLD92326.1 DUF1294 domain-containing protein [Alkalihalobacillus sp. AL-G]